MVSVFVVQCQGRQVHTGRDSGLERRHPVLSLYSRETKECSLFNFIQLKLELTAINDFLNLKGFLLKSKQEKIQMEETRSCLGSIKMSRFKNVNQLYKCSFCKAYLWSLKRNHDYIFFWGGGGWPSWSGIQGLHLNVLIGFSVD